MSDIVERLRRNCPEILDSEVRMEAAAEIERLRGLLRETLEFFPSIESNSEAEWPEINDLEKRVREALGDDR